MALYQQTSSGSWTPVLTFATPGNVSVVYAANGQLGTWTRIGKLVFLSFNLNLTSVTFTTASGNLNVTGLPFPGKNTTGLLQYGNGMHWSGITVPTAGETQLHPRVDPAASVLVFVASGSGVTNGFIATGSLVSGAAATLRGTINYETD